MPVIPQITGLPGLRAAQNAVQKIVFKGGPVYGLLAGGKLIDGSKSRDPTNTGNLDVLQPGLLMGKITSSSLYAPSVIGPTTVAFSSGTSLTVGAATAVELARRIGTSGTFKLVGPPAVAGIINVQTVTYSAVNQTTGVITITDPGYAFVSGSFVCPTDGSENILTFISDAFGGVKVTDSDGTTNLTVPFAELPIEGTVVSSQLVNWPTDAALQEYIVSRLNGTLGRFHFDHAA